MIAVSIAALFFMVKLHDKKVEREGATRRALSKRKDGKDSCITGAFIQTPTHLSESVRRL